jgi:RNA polymerase sigma-70 factor (ECF subfamily)
LLSSLVEDAELASRAGAGDVDAFEELVRRHEGLLRVACQRGCHDRESRQDAYQEALRAVWCGLASFRGQSKLSTWLYTVAWRAARRTAVRLDRANAVPYELPQPEPAPEGLVVTANSVAWALERLPPDFRVTLLLRVVEGLSIEQIAETLEISEGTVKSRINRARRALRELLATEDG